MKFSFELYLTEKQKIELYKLGQTTKFIYNYALNLISENYLKHKEIYTANEIKRILEKDLKDNKEVQTYGIENFISTIHVVIGAYRSYVYNKATKPTNREINDFSFVIYLDKYIVTLTNDNLKINSNTLLPNLKSNELIFAINTAKVKLKDKNLKDLKIRYDGCKYHFQGELIGGNSITKGLLLEFNNNYFVTSTDGIKIKKLVDDDAFLNKCLLILDLEESIKNKQTKKRIIYDAEINSLNFTKKTVTNIIQNYVNGIVKIIFESSPSFICTNYIKYNFDDLDIKDKINLYLIKKVRNKILNLSKERKIDYFITPINPPKYYAKTYAL